jgi:CDP-glucose 4,6-dehydratase
MELKSVYGGKKVFVTGHTGFKGSWLITWLHGLGANVKGYALAPESGTDLFHAIKGGELCHSVIADIRDREKLRQEITSFAPHFIFHLAAQPLVRYSYDFPVETFDVNVMGTAHLLDAVRFVKNPCTVVVITTDKVYHNKERDYFYKEEDPLGGYDPYSASKACTELVVDSYRNSFFNPASYDKHKKSISSARAGNVIGGGDWAKDRIVPDIIRALSAGQPVVVRNPASVRPWQHVLDPLHGYLQLGAHQVKDPVHFADAYNFGPAMEDKMRVGTLVEKAIAVWGNGKFDTPEQKDAPHEAGLLQLSIEKAKEKLSWNPAFSTDDAIRITVEWYRNNVVEKKDARSLLLQDINKLRTI